MVGGEQGRGVSWISYSHKLYHTITREGQSSFFFLFVPTLFPSLSLSRTPSPHSLTTLLLLFLTIPHLLSNQSHPLTSNLSPSLSTLMYMTVADGSSVYSHRCQITLIDDLSKINHFMLTFFCLLLFSEYASKGSGGGVTVEELVPFLITAPWRKEQLMLAGDIESNPGPYYTEYGEDLCMVLILYISTSTSYLLTSKCNYITSWYAIQ